MTAIAELIAKDQIAAEAAAKWAQVIIAGQPVTTKVCTRCTGKGSLAHFNYREMGICFGCRGTGIAPAYTPAQRAAMKQAEALEAAFWDLLNDTVNRKEKVTCTFPGGNVETCYAHDLISQAFQHLKVNAPARFARLLESLDAGRGVAVIAHLRVYAAEAGVYC